MATLTRFQHLALLAEAVRDDARAETRIKLGNGARAYSGETPRMIDGKSPFEARQCGWNTRERRGTVERVRGGGLKFKPYRGEQDPPAKPYKGPPERADHECPTAFWAGPVDGYVESKDGRMVPVATLASCSAGVNHESLVARDSKVKP